MNIDKLRELSARLQAAGWTPGAQAGYEEAQSAGAPKEVLRSIREICELCTEAANWFRANEAELLDMAKSITERDALLRKALEASENLSTCLHDEESSGWNIKDRTDLCWLKLTAAINEIRRTLEGKS